MMSLYDLIEEFRIDLESYLKTIKPSYLVIYDYDLPESEILKDNLVLLSLNTINLSYNVNNVLYEIQGIIYIRFNITKTKDLFKDILNLIQGLIDNYKNRVLTYSKVEILSIDLNAINKELIINFNLKTIDRR